MITLFAIVAIFGLLWLFFESAAKSTSVAPSMYRTSGNGLILIIIGVIGILCVKFLP
jgi:hypothetical protein